MFHLEQLMQWKNDATNSTIDGREYSNHPLLSRERERERERERSHWSSGDVFAPLCNTIDQWTTFVCVFTHLDPFSINRTQGEQLKTKTHSVSKSRKRKRERDEWESGYFRVQKGERWPGHHRATFTFERRGRTAVSLKIVFPFRTSREGEKIIWPSRWRGRWLVKYKV